MDAQWRIRTGEDSVGTFSPNAFVYRDTYLALEFTKGVSADCVRLWIVSFPELMHT